MRQLHLTTPLTRGDDVRHVQAACNRELPKIGRSLLDVDGEYGKLTAAAVRAVGFELGATLDALNRGCGPALQQLIINPRTQTPAQAKRAAARLKDATSVEGRVDASLAWLLSKVGTVESPPTSNKGPEIDVWERETGVYATAWCGCIQAFSLRHFGKVPVLDDTRYCPAVEAHAEAGTGGWEEWVPFTGASSVPADIKRWCLLFDWAGDGEADHIERGVAREAATLIKTVGGNTSDGDKGSPNEGGGVFINHRWASIRGFALPRWS